MIKRVIWADAEQLYIQKQAVSSIQGHTQTVYSFRKKNGVHQSAAHFVQKRKMCPYIKNKIKTDHSIVNSKLLLQLLIYIYIYIIVWFSIRNVRNRSYTRIQCGAEF